MKNHFLLKKKPAGLTSLLAKDFELLHNGAACGAFSFQNWKYAELLIGRDQFEVRSEGKGEWLLVQRGRNIASCKRYASGPKLEFAIKFDDRVWRFMPKRKRLVLAHEIYEKELEIGRVQPIIGIWWWSKIEVEFSEMPRLEIASFAVWITGVHWVGVAGRLTAARAQLGI